MTAPTVPPSAKTALIIHAIASLWILVNGLAHQVQVLYKGARGTLTQPQDLGALLLVGAGLIIAGGLMSASVGPLWKRGEVWWAVGSLASLAAVLVGTYLRYGGRFLVGSTVVLLVDLAALLLAAARRRGEG